MANVISGLQALFGGSAWTKQAEPKAAPQVFAPTFEKPVGYGPYGYVNKYMNPDYFATAETAEETMRRFGARERYERIAPGNEGPLYTCSKLQWWLRFDDGLELNAGTLAAYFARCPEDRFPGLADHFVREYIALARRERAAQEQEKLNSIPKS